ncbi:MAG TPA: energy transducer TonB [Thermoanaerobaculia bacterium]|jgi:TonB family protein
MKRALLILPLALAFAGSASAEGDRVSLDVGVFQGFRARATESLSPGSVVYLPPDPGWSDDVERQRAQIAENLGLEGVAVLMVGRVAGAYGATQTVAAKSYVYTPAEGGTTKEEPVTVTVRPVRTGGHALLLDLRLLLGAREIAAASVSGELGKTFILGGKPGGNPIFVAVTPRDAARPVAPRDALTVSGEIQRPRIVTRVEPSYPETLRGHNKSGLVLIQAIVNTDGSVGPATVVRHSDPEFDDSALAAVRQWHYEPATLRGAPVRVYLTITVSFRI